MEKIKICYRPTKHLFPHHSAQVLPAHPPPSPFHLPRSLHTPGIWLCLSAGLRGAQSTEVRDSASPGCGAGPIPPCLALRGAGHPRQPAPGLLLTRAEVCWEERAEHISAPDLLPFSPQPPAQANSSFLEFSLSFSPAPAILLCSSIAFRWEYQ